MPVDSLQPLVQALLSQLPEDPSTAVIAVKPEIVLPTPVNNQQVPPNDATYDPATVYLLELCTVLALRDPSTVESFGRDVAEALQNILRDTTSHHYITVSRSVFYLLSLLRASYVSNFDLI
jgi:brefeldin A-resistance guanine nucleotide exchange factor 1